VAVVVDGPRVLAYDQAGPRTRAAARSAGVCDGGFATAGRE